MAKQTRQSQNPRSRSAPVLPPIPTDTPEGIRAHAIRDTLRALEGLPDYPGGLELQSTDSLELAERLGVPPLYIETVYHESFQLSTCTPEHIEAYVAWRQRLAAGKAVA